MINDVETRFNINLEKKFGDKVERNTNFWKKESKNEFLSNFNFYNKPREKFEHYLLIKHDQTTPILMDTPDRVVWSWDLSNFRNNTKIIPYHLFKNGDLIIGKFESKGIYRIDKFGNIIWRNKNLNHHWIDIDNDNLFIPSRKFINLPDDLNSNLLNSELKNCNFKKSAFDTILILNSKTGKKIENISLMEELIKNNKFKKILNKKIKLNKNEVCKDPLHLNDIQKLSKKEINLIHKKISFTSDNILILSFRSLDMVLFYDFKNNKINHIIYDLFEKQHSPRLHNDGYLYVFDNNVSGHNSQIVKINLENNTIDSLFSEENFKSEVRGRIQFINNDLFVQSSSQGEVFRIICENDFFKKCKSKYLYSSNFSFFYPSKHIDDYSFKKDGIYIADFYEKNKIKFFD